MGDYRIGWDAHKRYSLVSVLDAKGGVLEHTRVNHEPGAITRFLAPFPEGTPVAQETVGNWYWIVDEMEEAGCEPRMAHAGKAKLMMGNVNKTDKLDADGLATLLHNGTLPTVWIPPGPVRDERELPRTRMALSKVRTALKNRIHATLAKYGISLDTQSDIFSPKWRGPLMEAIDSLPPETRRCVTQELELLNQVTDHISRLEARILERVEMGQDLQFLKTLPGIADILAIVIHREMGSVDRFPSPEHFASYSGTVPRVASSGGKTRYGRMRKESNHYLKWAFIEAANVVARMRRHPNWRRRHVCRVYERVRSRKGHRIAVGAVARHLSEAAFWVLRKGEPFASSANVPNKEPRSKRVSPRQG